VISFLKKYDKTHEVAMIYMSDHGESLGENSLYLHGLPYFIAPENQKHIGTIFWFGENMLEDIDIKKLKNKRNKKFTHDNLFHTLLGIFEVNSSVYNQKMDILKGCYTKEKR
jgi:lipid A ethanolaminephosphotransferase